MHGLSLVTFGIRTRTYKWTVYTRHEALQEAKLGLYYEAMWKHKQSDETNATKSSPSENFGKFKQGKSAEKKEGEESNNWSFERS